MYKVSLNYMEKWKALVRLFPCCVFIPRHFCFSLSPSPAVAVECRLINRCDTHFPIKSFSINILFPLYLCWLPIDSIGSLYVCVSFLWVTIFQLNGKSNWDNDKKMTNEKNVCVWVMLKKWTRQKERKTAKKHLLWLMKKQDRIRSATFELWWLEFSSNGNALIRKNSL